LAYVFFLKQLSPSMRKAARWLLAGASLVAFTLVAVPELHLMRVRLASAQADPHQVQLVTADIPRFWHAYDLAARGTAHAVQLFQREYFDQASPGLSDYFDLKIKSVSKFVANSGARRATTAASACSPCASIASSRRFLPAFSS
jgi:hypothetical protein